MTNALLTTSLPGVAKVKIQQNFISGNHETQPHETTAKNVSFKWAHYKILTAHSKVKNHQYSITNNTIGKCCSVAFI